MNYIKTLENDIEIKSERLEAYARFTIDLQVYLQSSKFTQINMVNVDDILLRIREFNIKVYS